LLSYAKFLLIMTDLLSASLPALNPDHSFRVLTSPRCPVRMIVARLAPNPDTKSGWLRVHIAPGGAA
jgi:hypothetical protein